MFRRDSVGNYFWAWRHVITKILIDFQFSLNLECMDRLTDVVRTCRYQIEPLKQHAQILLICRRPHFNQNQLTGLNGALSICSVYLSFMQYMTAVPSNFESKQPFYESQVCSHFTNNQMIVENVPLSHEKVFLVQ